MLKIEIKDGTVQTRSGVSAKTGKPYNIREQEAYAYVAGRDGKPAPYPVRISIALSDEGPGYNPGTYHLDPACIYVDRFGGLAIGKPRLVSTVTQAHPAKVA